MRRVLKTKFMLATSTLVVALSMTFAGMARATTIIDPGFDLFYTDPGSNFLFNTVPQPQVVFFEGVPLGTFDFGFGAENIGLTDTIVQRLEDADLTLGGGCGLDCDTIDIEIVALSLVSIAPVDLGFGAGFEDLFITLNTSSPSSQSTMTIFDTGEGGPHGTFDSIINFSFDVTGGIGGFYATIESTIVSSGNPWQHAPTGIDVIDDVNHLLNGLDETSDFWPLATGNAPGGNGLLIEEVHPGFGVHKAAVSPIPEPGTALLVGVGLVGLAACRRRRR